MSEWVRWRTKGRLRPWGEAAVEDGFKGRCREALLAQARALGGPRVLAAVLEWAEDELEELERCLAGRPATEALAAQERLLAEFRERCTQWTLLDGPRASPARPTPG